MDHATYLDDLSGIVHLTSGTEENGAQDLHLSNSRGH
ncbi:hypothetical protein [Sporisorium scitamineum]|uniref:Uncharacterized protein n=1 Tax=Sporisorium scitamineum TaxID=49012 RepID=A0A0F7RT38_9BASI|nr:hypothetical protein [Sporisorium scitamineum]